MEARQRIAAGSVGGGGSCNEPGHARCGPIRTLSPSASLPAMSSIAQAVCRAVPAARPQCSAARAQQRRSPGAALAPSSRRVSANCVAEEQGMRGGRRARLADWWQLHPAQLLTSQHQRRAQLAVATPPGGCRLRQNALGRTTPWWRRRRRQLAHPPLVPTLPRMPRPLQALLSVRCSASATAEDMPASLQSLVGAFQSVPDPMAVSSSLGAGCRRCVCRPCVGAPTRSL